MASTAHIYCKEIIRGLDKIPVYSPGDPVKLGDIITFGGTFFGTSNKPIGTFIRLSNLKKLGIHLPEGKDESNSVHTYASKKGVSVAFEADGSDPTGVNGKLKIAFSKKNSTYLCAVNCKEIFYEDISGLKEQIESHKDAANWNVCYIVNSITLASRAVIMQSDSKSGQLEIDGGLGNLSSGLKPTGKINAHLKVQTWKEAEFIKDLGDESPIFFSLLQYKKTYWGGGGIYYKGGLIGGRQAGVGGFAQTERGGFGLSAFESGAETSSIPSRSFNRNQYYHKGQMSYGGSFIEIKRVRPSDVLKD